MDQEEILKKMEEKKKLSQKERLFLLELCAKISVCILFDIDKQSVIDKFSQYELGGIIEDTSGLSQVALEELFHYAVFGSHKVIEKDNDGEIFLGKSS